MVYHNSRGDKMSYKIKEAAKIAGISVRTLHHYDRIGLLNPASATAAGYRLYTDRDLERLQQALFFKELGFSLQEIKEILDSPSFDRRQALTSQRKLLFAKRKRLVAIISAVEKTIESIEGGSEMSNEEKFAAFDMSEIENHQQKYAEKARQKYGNSEAYKESRKKTSRYTEDDWAAITAKGNEIDARIAALMDKEPSDPTVQAAIEDKRQHITDNFYTCTPEIFRGLGDMYVSDKRFTANIDKVRPGLAEFLQKAMRIYCDNRKE